MNTYKIGGCIVEGVNLLSAIQSLGFTNITIEPLWFRKSNGRYKVYCDEETIILCEWLNDKFKQNE